MRFEKVKEEEVRLGLTPLIDIVFLLLIFFMLTSHFQVASGVPVRLPQISREMHDSQGDKIILVIDREGRSFLEGEIIPIQELGPVLQARVEKEGLARLLLEADKEVKHGRVVEVMDLAKHAGVRSITIAARWKPAENF